MIELGSRVKSRTDGYEGIAVGRIEYLTGCNQIGIGGRLDKDGMPIATKWYDEPFVTVVDSCEVTGLRAIPMREAGGPVDAPPAITIPER